MVKTKPPAGNIPQMGEKRETFRLFAAKYGVLISPTRTFPHHQDSVTFTAFILITILLHFTGN